MSGRATALGAAVVLVLVMVAACTSPGPTTEPATRLATIDGAPWQLLVATEDGMRGRDGFDGADGMVFDQGGEVPPSAVTFVMDRVTVPLAIAWFGADGALVGIAAMDPCTAAPCPRYAAPAPFRWAVEAPPGAFDAIAPDARLEISPG